VVISWLKSKPTQHQTVLLYSIAESVKAFAVLFFCHAVVVSRLAVGTGPSALLLYAFLVSAHAANILLCTHVSISKDFTLLTFYQTVSCYARSWFEMVK